MLRFPNEKAKACARFFFAKKITEKKSLCHLYGIAFIPPDRKFLK